MIRIQNSIGRVLFFAVNWILRDPSRKALWDNTDIDGDLVLFHREGLTVDELEAMNQGDSISHCNRDLTEACQVLSAGLTSPTTKPVELIEQLTELIKSDRARSVLGGDTIQALRRLLLRPDQYGQLVQALTNAPLHCSHCGHPFSGNYESATISSRSILCANCMVPQTISCGVKECKGHARLNAKLKDAFRFKGRCHEHKEGLAEKLKATEEPTQVLDQTLLDNFIGMVAPPRPQRPNSLTTARINRRNGAPTADWRPLDVGVYRGDEEF